MVKTIFAESNNTDRGGRERERERERGDHCFRLSLEIYTSKVDRPLVSFYTNFILSNTTHGLHAPVQSDASVFLFLWNGIKLLSTGNSM